MGTLIQHPCLMSLREEAVGEKLRIHRRATETKSNTIGALKPFILPLSDECVAFNGSLSPEYYVIGLQQVRRKALHRFIRDEFQLFFSDLAESNVSDIDDRSP